MSLDRFLDKTCTILRPTAVDVDRYSQSHYEPVLVGADVRCRLIEKDIMVMDARSAQKSWVQVTMLIVPAGTDVQVKDEVTVSGVKYVVKKPLERKRANAQHHVSVIVEALNG